MLGVVKGVKTEKCNIMILISQRSSTDIKTVLTMTLAPLFTPTALFSAAAGTALLGI